MQHDGAASATAAWQEIRVDLASLHRLLGELSNEVSYNLRPNVDSVFDQLGTGASFGIKNPSIHNVLVALLGKPIAEAHALCIPTAIYPFPGGPAMG